MLSELRVHSGAHAELTQAAHRLSGGTFRYAVSQSRTDPHFKVGRSALGMQAFCNPVTHVPNPAPGDMADMQHAAANLPTHACSVNAEDGYRPEATLFVDEDWMALRAPREGKLGQLLFRPVVR